MFKARIYLAVILMAVLLISVPVSADPAPEASTKTKILDKLQKKHDRHPAVHSAMMKLRHAKRELEKATKETSPHKAKAIEAIKTALNELRESIGETK